MTVLSSLTMVASDRAATRVRDIQSMRQKLIDRIADLIDLPKADAAGQAFQRIKCRRVRDQETEDFSELLVKTPARPWRTVDQGGSVLLWVRYGNTNLELAKFQQAIRVVNRDELSSRWRKSETPFGQESWTS